MSDFELLIKLFDTLKDSSKETQQLCHAMLTNQQNIGNYIKTLPITDLKEALKEHSKDSADDIGTCTEKVKTTSDIILERVSGIEAKISKMITIVVVVVSLFSASILVGTLISNNNSKLSSKHSQLIIEQRNELEELRKTIEELHKK